MAPSGRKLAAVRVMEGLFSSDLSGADLHPRRVRSARVDF